MRFGYIYSLVCLVSLKEYIGQTICCKLRWNKHMRDALIKGSNLSLHSAIRHYGWHNFAVTILRRCSVDELDYWEEYYIDKFETLVPDGYNMTEGGGSLLGFRHSSASRQRMCKAQAERFSTKEARAYLSDLAKRRWETPAIRRKYELAQQARWTPEARAQRAALTKAQFTDLSVRAAAAARTRHQWVVTGHEVMRARLKAGWANKKAAT